MVEEVACGKDIQRLIMKSDLIDLKDRGHEMYKIGYIFSRYPERRCIVDKTNNIYVYHDIRKNVKYRLKTALQKLRLMNYWDKQSFVTLPNNVCDIWHSFNQVVNSKTPHVITFETQVPRSLATVERRWEWDKIDRKQEKQISHEITRLSNSGCKSLIAISQSAYDLELDLIERYAETEDTKIALKKMLTIISPPQTIFTTEEEIDFRYRNIETLRFLFVGNAFYRKGGELCIKAMDGLARKHKFELVIAGGIINDDALKHGVQREKIIQMLKERPWIQYCGEIDNQQVISLMKTCHVGLLPTYQDTYGFSVLEMQACGMPVITTAARALREINNNEIGWMIDVDTVGAGYETRYHEAEGLRRLESQLLSGLHTHLSKILSEVEQGNMNYLREKACQSYKRVKENHNPADIANQLNRVYDEVFAK